MNRRTFLSLPAGAFSAPPSFTDELWKSIESIYAKTLQHPFLRGLGDGTLPKSKFQFYLIQDALYLGVFARALEALAAHSPDPAWAADFRRDAHEAVETERSMHKEVLASYGITPRQIAAAEMAPVNLAYTNHLLLACTQRPFVEGLAAMLPCYWIYWEVGKHLKKSGSRQPEYQRWINQYADPIYGKAVARVLGVMNQSAAKATSAIRAQAQKAFVLSARYEYLFWDMAWREEKWLP
ncbi:MAG: thiaminase II [Acidobacteria bacterium]|nr:thiaminase II [Acidobacteriota bacterium]